MGINKSIGKNKHLLGAIFQLSFAVLQIAISWLHFLCVLQHVFFIKKNRSFATKFAISVFVCPQVLHDTWAPMNSLHKLSSAVILGVGTVSRALQSISN